MGKLPICVGKLPICVQWQIIILYSRVNVGNTYHIGATSLPSLYFQVKHCSRCQHSEKVKTIAAELHPITAEAPWDVVGVDLIGPFTTTGSGNRLVSTMTDLFTKFVYAKPIRVIILLY